MIPLLAALSFACRVSPDELARPNSGAPPLRTPATPPPAPGPSGEKLYQHLYAGELGEPAHAAGQRARMLAWISAMKLDAAQLTALEELILELERRQAADAAEQARIGTLEAEKYGPIYARIIELYARPDLVPPDTELAPLAAELEAARKEVYGGEDPRAAHYRRVREMIELARRWVDALGPEQRQALGECRFFLARDLGPFVAPGDYSDFLGSAWDGGDFGSLKTSARPSDEGHMDIGGLWGAERIHGTPDGKLQGLQLSVLVVMAAAEEGLPQAIEVAQGRRAPLDFSETQVDGP